MIKFMYPNHKQHKNKARVMIQKYDIKHKDYSHFLGVFSQLGFSGIMKKLGFYKERGIQPVFMMLQFLMSLLTTTSIFSFILRGGTATRGENYSKSALYRFLGNASYNWRALQISIAIKLSEKISALTENRRKFLIVDDSLYSRNRSKHTEMLSRVFDHVSQQFGLGFQYLSLCWTDGNTTLPCDFAMVGPVNDYDKRTLLGKRYEECTQSKPATVIAMIKRALDAGLQADGVLFDTWFATAPLITRIRALGLHVICMLKHMKNTSFLYDGEYHSLSELEGIVRKENKDSIGTLMSSRHGILGSLIVETKPTARAPDTVKAKVVFLRHRSNPDKKLAILSTDTRMKDEDIVRHYAKRWLIEVNFFNQKQLLGLVKKCRANLFASIIAHVTMVNICTMILEYIRREEKDVRTFGDIFKQNCEEIEDIPFSVAIDTLMRCFRKAVDTLNERHIIKEGKVEEAYAIVNAILNDWFRQQGEFFQNFIMGLNSDMKDLVRAA